MTGPDIHREVLDNLEDGVLVVGLGGRIETLNPAAERISGPGGRRGGGTGASPSCSSRGKASTISRNC